MNSSINGREIFETEDGKWDGVIRAFWRRIQRTPEPKYNNQLELPKPMPCEFRAHFATALLAAPEELRNLVDLYNTIREPIGWYIKGLDKHDSVRWDYTQNKADFDYASQLGLEIEPRYSSAHVTDTASLTTKQIGEQV